MRSRGPFLIAIAAVLWSMDALFRTRALQTLSPTFIVFCEHLICILALLPWILRKYGRAAFHLKKNDWISAAIIGAGASAIATVLFTESFKLTNPSVSILLQKLQPVIVILLAAIFLKEMPTRAFYGWAAVAILAAMGVSFPGFRFGFSSSEIQPASIGVLAALGAAIIWAVATVVGKVLLKDIPFDLTAFWRFVFGGLALAILLAFSPSSANPNALNTDLMGTLLYMALLSGLAAMLFYYAGLAKTPASVATLVELIFPITAVVVNAVFLHATLNVAQQIAAAALLVAVTRISRIKYLSSDTERS